MYRFIRATLAASAALIWLSGMVQAETLNPKQIAAVMAALDDEYYAVAFYDAVIKSFGPKQPFASIAKAEHGHVGLLTSLLMYADVKVPHNAYATGEKPIAAVPETLAEACRIAMTDEVEIAELFLSRLMPIAIGNEAMMATFSELSDTSEQVHMPAFRRCAS